MTHFTLIMSYITNSYLFYSIIWWSNSTLLCLWHTLAVGYLMIKLTLGWIKALDFDKVTLWNALLSQLKRYETLLQQSMKTELNWPFLAFRSACFARLCCRSPAHPLIPPSPGGTCWPLQWPRSLQRRREREREKASIPRPEKQNGWMWIEQVRQAWV